MGREESLGLAGNQSVECPPCSVVTVPTALSLTPETICLTACDRVYDADAVYLLYVSA